MFYSELLRQRVLGGKWLLEMGEETGGGNQDGNLDFEGRGFIPAGSSRGASGGVWGRPFIPENSSFPAISLLNLMKKSKGCVQQGLCPAREGGKTKHSSPKILPVPQKQRTGKNHPLRARQDARKILHSSLQNFHFHWLGHSEPEGKPSTGRDGGAATRAPPCCAGRRIWVPRGVSGTCRRLWDRRKGSPK